MVKSREQIIKVYIYDYIIVCFFVIHTRNVNFLICVSPWWWTFLLKQIFTQKCKLYGFKSKHHTTRCLLSFQIKEFCISIKVHIKSCQTESQNTKGFPFRADGRPSDRTQKTTFFSIGFGPGGPRNFGGRRPLRRRRPLLPWLSVVIQIEEEHEFIITYRLWARLVIYSLSPLFIHFLLWYRN